MQRTHLFSIGLGLIIAVAVVAMPGELSALESHPLLNDASGDCTGPTVGKVFQLSRGSNVLTLWIIRNGGANTTRQLFFVCSSGPCHGTACGFKSVGTITTNASGAAFKFLSYPNPFPGSGMHWDICPGSTSGCSGPNLWSGFFTSPFSLGESEAPSGGDPTQNQ